MHTAFEFVMGGIFTTTMGGAMCATFFKPIQLRAAAFLLLVANACLMGAVLL